MLRLRRQVCHEPWEVRTFPGSYEMHKSSSSLSRCCCSGLKRKRGKEKRKRKHTTRKKAAVCFKKLVFLLHIPVLPSPPLKKGGEKEWLSVGFRFCSRPSAPRGASSWWRGKEEEEEEGVEVELELEVEVEDRIK